MSTVAVANEVERLNQTLRQVLDRLDDVVHEQHTANLIAATEMTWTNGERVLSTPGLLSAYERIGKALDVEIRHPK